MTTLKALGATQKKGGEISRDAGAFLRQSIRNTVLAYKFRSYAHSHLLVSGVTVVNAALRADLGIMPITAVSAFLFLAAECARPCSTLTVPGIPAFWPVCGAGAI
jgi:hypothetical protein